MLIEYIWLYHYCKIINKACGMQTRFISNFVELFGTRVKNAKKFIMINKRFTVCFDKLLLQK